jgi:hypothetical protein
MQPCCTSRGILSGNGKILEDMIQFNDLTAQQKQALVKFPAYVSFLAATDSKLDEAEKMVAIKFAHTKSFSCHSILAEFYKESESVFEENLSQIEKSLPKDKISRDLVIKKELVILEKILAKLGNEYVSAMHHSMKTFKTHISRAHHSVIEDFILPISIPGLTD